MDKNIVSIDNVKLSRKGFCIQGSLVLSQYHLVFSFIHKADNDVSSKKDIWICYPVIKNIYKSRGSTWLAVKQNNKEEFNLNGNGTLNDFDDEEYDHYTASNIRIECADFTYYSFNFLNDGICSEVYLNLSSLISRPRLKGDISFFYAFHYRPNCLEEALEENSWELYDPIEEYSRQGLIGNGDNFWRVSNINHDYKFCPSYPNVIITPSSISDNVLKYTSKFRSKKRIPSVVYRHKYGTNGNVIARCSQPLVGLNLQNRSIQDEMLISEIFAAQEKERIAALDEKSDTNLQPQKNIIVDLRPLTNAVAQHALGAGTENIDNYKGKRVRKGNDASEGIKDSYIQQVEKIFGNIDNIHVIRDSLTKLNSVLSDLDRYPISNSEKSFPLLQQALVKTQWLHRLSIILQSVDRIIKSIHLNNTNVVIHCSDGWDRTSQVSALSQLCLDPFYRTMKGFIVLIEKEWVSFGFKFGTRADHGGCIGSLNSKDPNDEFTSFSNIPSDIGEYKSGFHVTLSGTGKTVSSFLHRAANHIKNTAVAAASSNGSLGIASDQENEDVDEKKVPLFSVYSGSNEKSPVFHQFLECVYQIYRQHPTSFEFNSRFLKRLFYHYYSCQYGTFLCDSEKDVFENDLKHKTVSVWSYFLSRPSEFVNNLYEPNAQGETPLFFNFSDIKWWNELYGRSDKEMNGLANSLDERFARIKLRNKNITNNEKK